MKYTEQSVPEWLQRPGLLTGSAARLVITASSASVHAPAPAGGSGRACPQSAANVAAAWGWRSSRCEAATEVVEPHRKAARVKKRRCECLVFTVLEFALQGA